MPLADLENAIAHLPWQTKPLTATRAASQAEMRRATSPTHPAAVARFLFTQLRTLAEDKRFELLRVSPTRFPILLLTVRQWSGACVTRRDGTGRTVPAAAERPRMRRKLRRKSPRPAWQVTRNRPSAFEIKTH